MPNGSQVSRPNSPPNAALSSPLPPENYLLIVTQGGFRSIAEQNDLYRIGQRGIKGEKKVTNAAVVETQF